MQYYPFSLYLAITINNKARANTHATVIKFSFGRFLKSHTTKEKRPNDNLITVACVFALVLLYSYS